MPGSFPGFLWRRGSRTAPLWLALLVIAQAGCYATKKDVRLLQDQITSDLTTIRARQDSLHRELQRQDRILLDTLRSSAEFTRTMSGRLNNDIRELKELVSVLQALLGQTQQRIAEARAEVQRLQEINRQPVADPLSPAPSASNPDTLYRLGMTKLADKSIATARLIFEQLLSEFPTHRLAPDAQYQLAETYYQERDIPKAYAEFERVVELHPSHARAPQALFRAGQIAEEQRERAKARDYYNRILRVYGTSDVAPAARRRLDALR